MQSEARGRRSRHLAQSKHPYRQYTAAARTSPTLRNF